MEWQMTVCNDWTKSCQNVHFALLFFSETPDLVNWSDIQTLLNIDAAAKYTQLGYEVTQRSLYDLALKGIFRFLIKERG